MSKDRFAKVEHQALLAGDEWHLDTIRFFRNSREIYRRYDDWKDIDRFYFTPLKLEMSYSIGGLVKRITDDTVYLGTFIKNTLEHRDLFTAPCPKCGRTLYPYGYNGSPLSGRVDLEATCDCGWDAYVIASGWRVRSEALKATQQADKGRLQRYRLCHGKDSGTISELLKWLSS